MRLKTEVLCTSALYRPVKEPEGSFEKEKGVIIQVPLYLLPSLSEVQLAYIVQN